jgi:integrase
VTVASVYEKLPGQYELQFTGPSRKRCTLWLGKVTKHQADEFAIRVDAILASIANRAPLDPVTNFWLGELPSKFKSRLAKHDLFDSSPAGTLAQLCRYCIQQADVEPSSLQKYRDAEANLLAFFGDRPLHLITAGDADEFAKWLGKHGRRPKPGPLASDTVSKRIEQCRSFFASALRKRWLNDNPFVGVRAAKKAAPDRQHYVTREVAQKLMGAADPQLRLIIALARYGGLRIPSEIRPLQLDWINRDDESLRVLSRKTKRHAIWRFVPLFPEIRTLLADAYDSAPEGVLLFGGLDISATAIRNRLERLCLRCGIVPWPKLWQNMRSTRETELIDEGYPIHTVCAWLGNSPKVALKHYLQVAKEHHLRAIGGGCSSLQQLPKDGPKTAV